MPIFPLMRQDVIFALPVKADKVPAGPDWIHEVKQDGYRMMLIRERKDVRLITKGGLNWTQRFPWIVEAALELRQQQFMIDGETVVLGEDGIADFNALHSRKHDHEAQFYAFDILAGGGEGLRKLPLLERKDKLAALLASRVGGIHAATFERGEIGPDLFRHACRMGLEGLVSKHIERSYRGGRCTHWVKVKNRTHPAFRRVQDQF
jgi:bifunctional non-homologous end joining protein LigD